MSIVDILAPWTAVNDALGLATPIRDEAHHAELLAFVDEAFERFGDDDAHPIFGLVSIVADRIREYEARVHPWPELPPHELLRALMVEHDIKQSELPEVGPQPVVSEVLSGKRALNLRQVAALAARFHVPMEVFTV
ncbi:transcriptional regulator [Zoogloea sp.]|uniref:helix-turn-helix domain-containing protein n=1 Tax=Zoogloea sp. TaxID=49181 RepID=UPI001AC74467|nr:transcriptional regulator [Zoogloea sp.]MBN8285499.1 transcriptional regulator [Zoogloea sp.]